MVVTGMRESLNGEPAIERLTRELLTDPFTVALQRKAQPATEDGYRR